MESALSRAGGNYRSAYYDLLPTAQWRDPKYQQAVAELVLLAGRVQGAEPLPMGLDDARRLYRESALRSKWAAMHLEAYYFNGTGGFPENAGLSKCIGQIISSETPLSTISYCYEQYDNED